MTREFAIKEAQRRAAVTGRTYNIFEDVFEICFLQPSDWKLGKLTSRNVWRNFISVDETGVLPHSPMRVT